MLLDSIAKSLEKALSVDLIQKIGGISVHSINKSASKAAALYYNQNERASNIKIGGNEALSYEFFSVNLLLRLGKDGNEADSLAHLVYKGLFFAEFDDLLVILPNNRPVWLGADKFGVHEYSIDIEIYTHKEDLNNGLSS